MENTKATKNEDKQEEPEFNAYTISKGNTPIQYRLIRLQMKGKQLKGVEVILEEILPVVIAKVEQVLRQESLQC